MDKIKENWKRIQSSLGFIGYLMVFGFIALCIFWVGRFSAPEIDIGTGDIMRQDIITEFTKGTEKEQHRQTWYWPPSELIESGIDLKDVEALMEKIEK